MGAFNEVRVPLICPNCGLSAAIDVQFKYGSVVHHKYTLGSALRWGANDVGVPGRAVVVVDGEGSRCPHCGWNDDWPVYVLIENDVIRAVSPATGEHDFTPPHETFVVLRER